MSVKKSIAWAAKASTIASANTITQKTLFYFTQSFQPYRWVAIPLLVSLGVIFSILGVIIVSQWRFTYRKWRRADESIEHDIVTTKLALTQVGLRSRKQSPILPSFDTAKQPVAEGQDAVSTAVIQKAKISIDPLVSVPSAHQHTSKNRSSQIQSTSASESFTSIFNEQFDKISKSEHRPTPNPSECLLSATSSDKGYLEKRAKPFSGRLLIDQAARSLKERDHETTSPMVRKEISMDKGGHTFEPSNAGNTGGRHRRSSLSLRLFVPSESRVDPSHKSRAERNGLSLVQERLNTPSPPSDHTVSKSHENFKLDRSAASQQSPVQSPIRDIMNIDVLRKAPPRAGRKAPERFADSKYSIWNKF